jgi:hypothetical protein
MPSYFWEREFPAILIFRLFFISYYLFLFKYDRIKEQQFKGFIIQPERITGTESKIKKGYKGTPQIEPGYDFPLKEMGQAYITTNSLPGF